MQATRTDTRRRVHVRNGLFVLAVGDASLIPPHPVPDPWRRGHLVEASHVGGLVTIATGVGDGQIGVRLRTWGEQPPMAPLGERDEAEEVSLRTRGDELRLGTELELRGLDRAVPTLHDWVRVRCVARGRRVRRCAEGDSAERYLIDVWPELDAPRETHRVRLRARRAGT